MYFKKFSIAAFVALTLLVGACGNSPSVTKPEPSVSATPSADAALQSLIPSASELSAAYKATQYVQIKDLVGLKVTEAQAALGLETDHPPVGYRSTGEFAAVPTDQPPGVLSLPRDQLRVASALAMCEPGKPGVIYFGVVGPDRLKSDPELEKNISEKSDGYSPELSAKFRLNQKYRCIAVPLKKGVK